MLSINNLTKRFRGRTVLDSVSLTVEPGSIALLMGRSGVGKSTLLRILAGLERADEGSILIDGAVLSPHEHTVGMVFQHFNLFDLLTVEENITFPLIRASNYSTRDAKMRAQELLARFKLSELSSRYPAQLSGGQKQRLAIARALAQRPRIICMDEPTSALDPLLAHDVAAQINTLAQEGYIVVIASHDIKLVDALSCTIHLMHEGRIVESGTSSAIRQNKKAFLKIDEFIRAGQKIAA
jgi:polar amino acid transport system ATP-binding protein